MTSAASGAVFFLGTRAHYQVLEPPDARNYDIENGNESSETTCAAERTEPWQLSPAESARYDCNNWISCARSERSTSEMMLLDYRPQEEHATSKVTRRFKKNKWHDDCSDRIISREESVDIDPVALNKLTYRDSIKSKESVGSTRCASLKALLGNLKARRKHKLSLERLDCLEGVDNALDMCTYKDSCRCLDCQSRYFECDESDSEYSVSSGNYDDYDDYDYSFEIEYKVPTPTPVDNQPSTSRDSCQDDNDEVFIDTPPDNASVDLLIKEDQGPKSPSKEKMSVTSDEVSLENPLDLEMAAGTPVVLDYLLNHPITCCVQ